MRAWRYICNTDEMRFMAPKRKTLRDFGCLTILGKGNYWQRSLFAKAFPGSGRSWQWIFGVWAIIGKCFSGLRSIVDGAFLCIGLLQQRDFGDLTILGIDLYWLWPLYALDFPGYGLSLHRHLSVKVIPCSGFSALWPLYAMNIMCNGHRRIDRSWLWYLFSGEWSFLAKDFRRSGQPRT